MYQSRQALLNTSPLPPGDDEEEFSEFEGDEEDDELHEDKVRDNGIISLELFLSSKLARICFLERTDFWLPSTE